MKKLIPFLFFLTFILISNLSAQFGWQIQNHPATNPNFHSVFFVDANTGYIGGGGEILKTTNGGDNWIIVATSGHQCSDIFFTSPDTGYYVREGNSQVYKTVNGGYNWNGYGININRTMYSIHFPSKNTGYAGGEQGFFCKTTDAGLNWDTLSLYYTGSVNCTQFLSNDVGYASMGSTPNRLLMTINGGANWGQIYFGSVGIQSFQFLNGNTGYAAGSPQMIKTVNGGGTWTNVNLPGSPNVADLFMTSSTTGYAVGQNHYLIATKNGSTWEIQNPLITDGHLTSVHFVNDLTGWIVGVSYLGGIIRKTTTGGLITSTKNISQNTPEKYFIYQNYPNPFNPFTNIKFDIPKSSHVNIIVYDVLGKEITTLVNEKLSSGSYEVEWNATHYASGVYFYALKTEEYNIAKKLVLIK